MHRCALSADSSKASALMVVKRKRPAATTFGKSFRCWVISGAPILAEQRCRYLVGSTLGVTSKVHMQVVLRLSPLGAVPAEAAKLASRSFPTSPITLNNSRTYHMLYIRSCLKEDDSLIRPDSWNPSSRPHQSVSHRVQSARLDPCSNGSCPAMHLQPPALRDAAQRRASTTSLE